MATGGLHAARRPLGLWVVGVWTVPTAVRLPKVQSARTEGGVTLAHDAALQKLQIGLVCQDAAAPISRDTNRIIS